MLDDKTVIIVEAVIRCLFFLLYTVGNGYGFFSHLVSFS